MDLFLVDSADAGYSPGKWEPSQAESVELCERTWSWTRYLLLEKGNFFLIPL